MTNNNSPLSRSGGSIPLPGSVKKQLGREERLEKICEIYDRLCAFERAVKADLSEIKTLINRAYDLAAAGRPCTEEGREIVALVAEAVRAAMPGPILAGRELRAAAVRIFVAEDAAGEAFA